MEYLRLFFCFLVPYFLFAEILYVSLKGANDMTIFMWNGLFGSLSQVATFIAWIVDVLCIVAGIGAIIYGVVCLMEAYGEKTGNDILEQSSTTVSGYELHETMFGNYKAEKKEVKIYDSDARYSNAFKLIFLFLASAVMDVAGIVLFIVYTVKYAKGK